ncbi:hypothetical protein Barb6_01876 [Bacteroidales bacterium Barb6]|nr:hypothetical protein Barb6_01876 [Bacteroidales bacterium Barb6]
MTKLSGLIRNTGWLWYSALTLFIFYGSILFANVQGDIVIHGKIIDEGTGETVIGATVFLVIVN